MAKPKTNNLPFVPGMMTPISYGLLFAANGLVISLANTWFPQYVVLGTVNISALWAVLLSAGVLALIGTLTMPFFQEYESRRGRMLSDKEWMVGYLVVNFVGVWLVARVSEIFGLGVTSWMVVLGLAAVLDLVQGFVMMGLEKYKTQKQ
ncbi:MAG: hypothetical protein HZA34_01870 [Candidatus Pacebacteria bacterium]|nr:hypothetical protein [Candidatus Paceibacterota bacterium]